MASHYSTTPPKHASDVVVATPCGACKMLRKRCVEKCILAPHFPPTEPIRFTMAHRVFGASNIIKLLQVIRLCICYFLESYLDFPYGEPVFLIRKKLYK
ncbi:putative transcription factor AS2-LOB family [Helianthus debilis subsp. tardiflorus]